MGFRFQRRIKIMPGVTLNVGKRGVSTSIGRRGAHITFGQNGVRTTVGIPGTGISYTSIRRFQSLRMRRRRGAGRRRGRIFRSVRTAGMGCGSAGIYARHVIIRWSSRCRRMRCVAEGAGGCMRGICSVSARRAGAGFWIRRWKSCRS